MKRFITTILVLAMSISMFTGCATKAEETTVATTKVDAVDATVTDTKETETSSEKPHIVFVTPLIAHPVWMIAKEGFDTAAADYDFTGDWVGPSVVDANEMIKQIEVAIAEKADGIITQGINPQAMVPVLEKAEKAGIPVVVVNSDIPDAPRLAYLGTDPVNLGSMGGEAIVEKLGGKEPKVAYMCAMLDYEIGQNMIQGYRDVLSKQTGYEEMTIQESQADMLTAVQKWQDIFNTYPDTNVAISVAGESGAACAQVVKEMGLEDQVIIMAIDDTQETIDGIKEGVIFGTMTQNFYRKGYQASQWILDYIKNGTKPTEMLNDSGTMVVTIENVETYATDMKNPDTWK